MDDVASIDEVEVALAAPWAQDGLFWLVAACAAVIAIAEARSAGLATNAIPPS